MNKWLILFCFVLSCSAASGQITVEEKFREFYAVPSSDVRVTDAEGGFPLEGAVIRFVEDKKDTVSLVSDRRGEARFDRKLAGDSVKITVSYLGYKKLEYTYKISSPWIDVYARMSVDPLEISSIVIKGEQIAMISRGDTTIYRAGAFKTMRSDPLSDLLKKLPGVEMREGKLYANGRIVQRILVNGTPLFGNYMDRAQELIRADNVENVKVYDQHSAQSIINGDTLKPKERVLDVTTKKKEHIVRQAFLGASAGIYLDKNANGNYEELYGIRGSYDRHKVGGNLVAWLDYGEKIHSLTMPSGNFYNGFNGMLNWDRSFGKKYRFSTNTFFSDDRNKDDCETFDDYFPTESYASRQQTILSDNRDRKSRLTSVNTFSYRINRHHNIQAVVQVAGNRSRLDSRSYNDLMLNDERTYLSDMRTHRGQDEFSVDTRLSYNYNFNKSGRRLKSEVSFVCRNGRGDGLSIDTLASGSKNVFLTNTQNSRSRVFKGQITYSEPLSKKTNLNLIYQIERNRTTSDRISVDRLTGVPDLNNTYDFTNDYLKNSVSAGLRYRNGDKIQLHVHVKAQSSRQKREEVLPDDLRESRTYTNLLPSLKFIYKRGSAKNLELDYVESVSIPSVEQLRGALNTYRAPFYTAGNPSLKESVERKVNMTYSVVNAKRRSSLHFQTALNFYQRSVVTREIFFATATVCPEYGDFEFPAGSTLRIAENASGRFSCQTNVSYRKDSKRLQALVIAALGYSFERMPYYLYETLNTNDMHRANLMLDITSDFSRKIELSLSSATSLGYGDRDDRSSLKDLSETVNGRIRWNFIKRLWLKADGSYRYRNSTMPGTELQEVILNAELTCMFGKNDAGSIGIHANDLLNQARAFTVQMENDRISVQRRTILGRNIFVSFSYKF